MTAEEAVEFCQECKRGDVYDQAKRLVRLIHDERIKVLHETIADIRKAGGLSVEAP